MSKEVLLKGEKITKVYRRGKRDFPVLSELDVEIYKGDFTVIMGPSGAGKSTLLYALSGLESLSSGKVFYKGKDIGSLSEKKTARMRAEEMGFVFQQAHMVSNMTLLENIAVAGYLDKRKSEKEVKERALQLVKETGIEEAAGRLPSAVSGGEAQRAAIAAAIINQPDLLFVDEPTGALNRKNSDLIFDLLIRLYESSQSILMVTHDLRAAVRGTRILYLEDGKILDRLIMTPFKESEEKEREERVSSWLSKLSW